MLFTEKNYISVIRFLLRIIDLGHLDSIIFDDLMKY